MQKVRLDANKKQKKNVLLIIISIFLHLTKEEMGKSNYDKLPSPAFVF